MALQRKLNIGVKGSDVERVQLQLSKLGFSNPATGVFTATTRSAVIRCQKHFGMEMTGVAGFELQEKLNKVCPEVLTAKVQRPPDDLFSNPIKVAEIRPGPPPSPKMVVIQPEMQEVDSGPSSTEKAEFSILAVTVGDQEHVEKITQELSESLECPWSILVVSGSVVSRPDGSMRIFKLLRPSSDDVMSQWDQALKAAANFVDSCRFVLLCPSLGTKPQRTLRLAPALVENDAQVALGAWFDTSLNESISPRRNVIMDGRVNVSATLIRTAFLSSTDGLDLSYGECAFQEMFLRWHLQGVKFAHVTGAVVFSGPTIEVPSVWPELRDKAVSKLWSRPKISALLLTGKCVERYALAKVAVQCFFDQTWPNKELVIVNHGPLSLSDWLPPWQRAFVREIRFNRPDDMTIGDMRNLSMDSASGDWMIQWDDDDWHHPLRMEVQFSKAEEDVINTLEWQVRCNIGTGASFYDKMPGGQHMSVFYPRTSRRYEKLNAREDTAFFKSFGRIRVISNSPENTPIDPMLYVRFFHGRNIWDRQHIMGGSDQNRSDNSAEVDLNEYHQRRMKNVLQTYAQSSAELEAYLVRSGIKNRNATNGGGNP